MKSILVIDIPDHVNSINKGILKPIGTVGKLEICYGSDDGEISAYIFIDTDGMLLKPMPQRKKNSIVLQGEVNIDIPVDFLEKIHNQGYNDCIDELLGEPNESNISD